MRFVEEMEGVTPILTDMPPRETLSRPDGPHSGNPFVREAVLQRNEPQHVAWAYERPNGNGRGFGFTGGHFHRNWGDDNFRKLVLNAIVWTAGGEVPDGGVLVSNADSKKNSKPIRTNPNPIRPTIAGDNVASPVKSPRHTEIHGPRFPRQSSPQTRRDTPLTSTSEIAGAESLFLVVTDARDGYGCDWADWAEPRLVGEDSEQQLTELNGQNHLRRLGTGRVNQNAGGGALRIGGQSVEYGIGTHANSIIEYELPADHAFTRFPGPRWSRQRRDRSGLRIDSAVPRLHTAPQPRISGQRLRRQFRHRRQPRCRRRSHPTRCA